MIQHLSVSGKMDDDRGLYALDCGKVIALRRNFNFQFPKIRRLLNSDDRHSFFSDHMRFNDTVALWGYHYD